MGLCVDKSVNYLASLGFNTILQPEEGIASLALLGELDGQRALIGMLDQLVRHATEALPVIASAAVTV